MSARKTERLLNLVIALLATRRYLTVEQIRSAVPGYAADDADGDDTAFRRMFERDKEELRALGIPLETGTHSVWDDDVGYRIARGRYELPEISLSPDEAAAVGLAARLWSSSTLADAVAAARRKLAAAGVETEGPLPEGLEPRVDAAEPAFAALLDATVARRAVAFDYRRPESAAAARRRLQPWGLVSWRGRWYVAGHDLDRAATRVFRLSRITGSVAASGPAGAYDVPPGVDLRTAVAELDRGGSPRPARLRVRAGAAYGLRRQAVGVEPAGAGDGWDLVTVVFTDATAFAGMIAGYGCDVVVEDPPDARDAVVRHLASLVDARTAGGGALAASP